MLKRKLPIEIYVFLHDIKRYLIGLVSVLIICKKKGAETKEKEIHHATIVENMDDLVAKMDYILVQNYDKQSFLGLKDIVDTKI